MHFFGAIGLLCLFVGVVTLMYLSISKLYWDETGIADRPLFYFGILLFIVGTQLFVTGFLAELIVRSTHRKGQYLIRAHVYGEAFDDRQMPPLPGQSGSVDPLMRG